MLQLTAKQVHKNYSTSKMKHLFNFVEILLITTLLTDIFGIKSSRVTKIIILGIQMLEKVLNRFNPFLVLGHVITKNLFHNIIKKICQPISSRYVALYRYLIWCLTNLHHSERIWYNLKWCRMRRVYSDMHQF